RAGRVAARLGGGYAFDTMRKVTAVLLALIFAGSVGGVGCFAAASAAAAASAMACCTPDCPSPTAPSPRQSCATQTCAPSVEVAPGRHGALHPRPGLTWAAAAAGPFPLRAMRAAAAAPRSALPPSVDS